MDCAVKRASATTCRLAGRTSLADTTFDLAYALHMLTTASRHWSNSPLADARVVHKIFQEIYIHAPPAF
eukprot:COSAG02_NODE_5978_length_3898_cov_1.338510_5_plen_69_part_00